LLPRAVEARCAETAADKPTFVDSLRLRRCLVPADGWYEWQQLPGRRKQPFAFRLWDDKPFALAALWDLWKDPAGRPLPTFALLTTQANELVRPVHGRTPVIVPERHLDLWLARGVQEPADLAPVLRPYPADAMRAFSVSEAVNDPWNDGPECLAAG
jgi:putative SOS response-associated peptidase YedK